MRKTKTVDEETGVAELQIPSPIKKREVNEEIDVDKITAEIPPPTLEDRIQHSMEKSILSNWLNVMQSATNRRQRLDYHGHFSLHIL